MRNRIRRSGGVSAPCSGIPRWISIAQRTAPTTLLNSTSRLSPTVHTQDDGKPVLYLSICHSFPASPVLRHVRAPASSTELRGWGFLRQGRILHQRVDAREGSAGLAFLIKRVSRR